MEISNDLLAIQLACKIVSNALKRAGLEDVIGYTGTQNIHGEDVKKLDLLANDAWKTALQTCDQVRYLYVNYVTFRKGLCHGQ